MSGLTVEHKATNYDTFRHIERVRNLLNKCVLDLLHRGEKHDQSKLESPEVELFTEFTPKLAGCTYGSAEYDGFREAMGPALAHHYANNSHHPEFYRQNEEWRSVVGFEGFYEVSNFGDVRSIDRLIERSGPTGSMIRQGQILCQNITPKGYCRVQLTATDRKKNAMVHRLVAEAFIPNPEQKPQVNHKFGDKRDNRAGTLEWSTACENLQHAYDTGLKEATIKYVVECESLGIITHGCEAMAKELRSRGYDNASAAAIWSCINRGGRHLDLEFTGSKYETWMNSPMNDMNLLDVVEMLCDWKAASERHNDGNIRKSITINANRFNMSPQLVKILENTADLLFAN